MVRLTQARPLSEPDMSPVSWEGADFKILREASEKEGVLKPGTLQHVLVSCEDLGWGVGGA